MPSSDRPRPQPSPRQPGARRHAVIAPVPAQVRPGWLLGALGLLLLAACFFAYLSLCLLFVQGQWQLLYRPGEHSARPAGHIGTPADAGLAFTEVRFGATRGGPQHPSVPLLGGPALSGWWLPASPGAALAGTTVLYLHDATGSLSDTVPELARLHRLGCAVFAIDYRGYGSSAAGQPGEAAMLDDTRSAVAYLTGTRHLAGSSLRLWGRGVGATLAAEISAPALPLVLEDVNLPAVNLLENDPRTRWLPVRLLVRDRLDAGSAIQSNPAPKLFLGSSEAGGTRRLYSLAAMPKQFAAADDEAAIRAFLLAASAGTGSQSSQ